MPTARKRKGDTPVPQPLPEETTTRRFRLAGPEDGEALRVAIEALRRGELVVFPTETFYGVAALPDHEGAIAKLVQLKERDGKPIPLIAASRAAAERISSLNRLLLPLADALWPGPLTLTMASFVEWPGVVAPDQTLGIRVSAHPIAAALAAGAGGLITATSANLRGMPPATLIEAIGAPLLRAVRVILDGGLCAGGEPSTVVGVRDNQVVVLRPGAVSQAALSGVLGYEPQVVQ